MVYTLLTQIAVSHRRLYSCMVIMLVRLSANCTFKKTEAVVVFFERDVNNIRQFGIRKLHKKLVI